MSQNLKYKGYIGSVECDFEENMLHGRVQHTTDLITYDGSCPEELQTNFESAVDSYLAACKKYGKEPLKSMSGTFNCRIGPDLHKQLALFAAESGKNINSVLIEAVEFYIHRKGKQYEMYSYVLSSEHVRAAASTRAGQRNERFEHFYYQNRSARAAIKQPAKIVDIKGCNA